MSSLCARRAQCVQCVHCACMLCSSMRLWSSVTVLIVLCSAVRSLYSAIIVSLCSSFHRLIVLIFLHCPSLSFSVLSLRLLCNHYVHCAHCAHRFIVLIVLICLNCLSLSFIALSFRLLCYHCAHRSLCSSFHRFIISSFSLLICLHCPSLSFIVFPLRLLQKRS